MNIVQVEFDRVFTGQSNFAPKAIIQCSMADLARRFRYIIYEGEDGLDRYSAIPMVLQIDHNDEFDFALWRHEGNPENTFSINASIYENMDPSFLALILRQLDISENHVIWRAPELVASPEAVSAACLATPVAAVRAAAQAGHGATMQTSVGASATGAAPADAVARKGDVARVSET